MRPGRLPERLGDRLVALLAKVPFGQLGEPDDVAYLVVCLASDEAKDVNGSEFMVDGGWHLGQAS